MLIAEDHPVNRKLTVRQLERLGIHAVTVENGRQAVDAVWRTAYDVIFMDCQMPQMDGFEATEAIRRLEAGKRRTPIVALTANALAGDRQRCLDAGMAPAGSLLRELDAAYARAKSALRSLLTI